MPKISIMKLSSSAFGAGDVIPDRYTCQGDNVSPPLEWTDPPDGTKSFALIADDPDAPMGTWVHWVAWNVPASLHRLSENVPNEAALDNGIRQGTNDGRKIGYSGPCPPPGKWHRYFFKLYALNIQAIPLPEKTTKADLLSAIKDSILAQAETMGKYKQ